MFKNEVIVLSCLNVCDGTSPICTTFVPLRKMKQVFDKMTHMATENLESRIGSRSTHLFQFFSR